MRIQSFKKELKKPSASDGGAKKRKFFKIRETVLRQKAVETSRTKDGIVQFAHILFFLLPIIMHRVIIVHKKFASFHFMIAFLKPIVYSKNTKTFQSITGVSHFVRYMHYCPA